jgi:hypothetical protein
METPLPVSLCMSIRKLVTHAEHIKGMAGVGTSPDDGTFEIRGVPDGTYYLKSWSGESNYVGEWWAGLSNDSSLDCNAAQSFSVTSGETVSGLEFQLEAGGAVSGHLYVAGTDPLQPIANVHVNVTSEACGGFYLVGGRTDENGFYRINGVLPGSVYIRTEAAPHGFNYVDESWEGAVDCSAATGISVTAGAEASSIDFNLSPGATISGHVYQQDGTTQIENVHVYVTDADTGQWIGGDNTDATGLFSVKGLPPGECLVQSAHPAAN